MVPASVREKQLNELGAGAGGLVNGAPVLGQPASRSKVPPSISGSSLPSGAVTEIRERVEQRFAYSFGGPASAVHGSTSRNEGAYGGWRHA